MMLPLVVVGWLHIKAVCRAVREYHRLRRDNAASPDWQTLLNGIVTS